MSAHAINDRSVIFMLFENDFLHLTVTVFNNVNAFLKSVQRDAFCCIDASNGALPVKCVVIDRDRADSCLDCFLLIGSQFVLAEDNPLLGCRIVAVIERFLRDASISSTFGKRGGTH